MIKKEIKPTLINTWETMDKLREDYIGKLSYKSDKLKDFKEYFDGMDKYERDILILYSEYGSYRKVADETYCTHNTIKLIMSCIRNDISKLIS